MRELVLFVCLSVGCLAQRPHQCTSPPLLTGRLSVSTTSGKLTAHAKYTYDAIRERIRFTEFGSYNNKTFYIDLLLLFREGIVYKINYQNHTCWKKPLEVEFHPLAVPKNATLLGQVVLGSSSGPGQGVLTNIWTGDVHTKKGTGKYLYTVTVFGCVPISTLFYTDKTGWVVASFFDNVIGLADPERLILPAFCKDAQLEEGDGTEPVPFFNLF